MYYCANSIVRLTAMAVYVVVHKNFFIQICLVLVSIVSKHHHKAYCITLKSGTKAPQKEIDSPAGDFNIRHLTS